MKCSICGRKINNRMYFCPTCGHRLKYKSPCPSNDNDFFPFEFIDKDLLAKQNLAQKEGK